jgi:hypothetical protein
LKAADAAAVDESIDILCVSAHTQSVIRTC